jgi:hypothetical protein
MKIKNIVYVVSLIVFAGINAAELPASIRSTEQPLIAQQILHEITLSRRKLHEASDVAARKEGYVWKATGAIKSGSSYAFHVFKYPAMFAGAVLPVFVAFKDDFTSRVKDYLGFIMGAAVVTGVAAGIYYGPNDFRSSQDKKNTEADKLDQDFIVQECAQRLVRERLKVIRLENVHGAIQEQTRLLEAHRQDLQRLQTNMHELTRGCADAQQRLRDLQTAGQASTALAQIESINAQLVRHAQLIQSINTIMQSNTEPRMRRLLVFSAQRMLAAAEHCERARTAVLSQVQGNPAFLSPENERIISTLKDALETVFEEQVALQQNVGRFLSAIQMEIVKEDAALEEQGRRLGLEVAAVSAQAQPAAAPSNPVALLNGHVGLFGLPAGSFSPLNAVFGRRSSRPSSPVELSTGGASGNASDDDEPNLLSTSTLKRIDKAGNPD